MGVNDKIDNFKDFEVVVVVVVVVVVFDDAEILQASKSNYLSKIWNRIF